MSRNIWVISDTHFNHGNIIDYCERPFKSTEEMDNTLVENWNKVVKDNDVVYHLGDVYFSGGRTDGYISTLLSRLRGRQRLVLGNHDNGKDPILQTRFQKISVWRMFPEFGLLLTHVPVHESSLFRGASGNEKNPPKLRNVHGHIHTAKAPSADHFCACVEQTSYAPVNIEELRKW